MGFRLCGPRARSCPGLYGRCCQTPAPPQTHLADDPLETSKHCIKEKAARLRGLPFLAYSCSGGAKMTLARGGSKPAVVRGHLASKTAYVCRFSPKKRPYRRVRGFVWRFWLFGAPKTAYVSILSRRRARKYGYVCKKSLLEASGDPGGPTNWHRGLTHRALLVYKLAPASDPQSVGHLAVAFLASSSTANTDPPILVPSNTDPPTLSGAVGGSLLGGSGGRWVTSWANFKRLRRGHSCHHILSTQRCLCRIVCERACVMIKCQRSKRFSLDWADASSSHTVRTKLVPQPVRSECFE